MAQGDKMSRYYMDQSEILENICMREVISDKTKPKLLSLQKLKYFQYLTMGHAISVFPETGSHGQQVP